jgi:TPR repeat protein
MGQEEIEGTQEHPIVISRFSVLPSQTGDFTIPAFDIKTQTSEILHVQTFTLHVFAPDQNIPPQLLVAQSQGANISPPPPPAAPPETLTVLSATTGKVVKVIHYSSAGVPIDQSASPATSLSTSPTPSNSGQPAPDSSAPAPPNPSGVTGTSAVTSQSGVQGNQPFDDKTPLDVVEDGASKANPEAEYQFAERLLSAAARSPGAVKLLDEEATDYFNYYNSHPGPYYMDKDPTGISDANASRYQGSPSAQVCLAKKHTLQQMLDTVNRDETQKALNLLKESASKNFAPALVQLAVLYNIGHENLYRVGFLRFQSSSGCAIDKQKSFDAAQRATDLGSPEGMRVLGILYATGDGIPKDIAKGVGLIKKSADTGDLTAYSLLSNIYSDGGINGRDDGFPKDYVQAYIMGRALQELSEPRTQMGQWAKEDADKARTHLTPEELLSSEDKVAAEEARLKSLSNFLPPPPQLTIKAAGLTKDQWRAEVGKVQPLFAATGVLKMARNDFESLCGVPDKTETVGNDVYWYYSCSDGVLQLIMDKNVLNSGTIIITRVNDY